MDGEEIYHALNIRTAKPCSSLMSHSVAPISVAVCNKARSPLGDRQCAHEQGANLESGENFYSYACGRDIEESGVFVRGLSVEFYVKITDKNPLNHCSRLTCLLVVNSNPSWFVLVRVVRGKNIIGDYINA
jgi:hypothetical protein